MWRIGRQDIEDYIAEAYRRTAERIAAGEITDEAEAGGD
ncbi:UNVERIFIED_ORG: ATP-dependent Lon protease [Arthrobacter sp. UYEF13]